MDQRPRRTGRGGGVWRHILRRERMVAMMVARHVAAQRSMWARPRACARSQRAAVAWRLGVYPSHYPSGPSRVPPVNYVLLCVICDLWERRPERRAHRSLVRQRYRASRYSCTGPLCS